MAAADVALLRLAADDLGEGGVVESDAAEGIGAEDDVAGVFDHLAVAGFAVGQFAGAGDDFAVEFAEQILQLGIGFIAFAEGTAQLAVGFAEARAHAVKLVLDLGDFTRRVLGLGWQDGGGVKGILLHFAGEGDDGAGDIAGQ
jgi:hypothetical protein